ncbi:MAG: sodium:solute symporter family protein [Candidatus Marinimicrobia bacterium]|jgi:SSS family solute:Na+ symporter|nr:sodium:solute symporter family protein [Candidatus Neomarinimicrobiota bacterium]MBT3732974.1 sodium:solute symporter family protein [Candidatus Neomarinimicrobiota bacterium]MBT4178180.1 sodium:solute symporter family protein [Candidatus Neomarinimicrobiota bacterium]MBT4991317.1 sodium:solute symporter family protein [Candidatus Neomarinimicrobiota bacterium]MBT5355609.1 sodium:solute symporter family protein [Candidatus Neomarinimicrobiota bacterium]
MQQVSSTFWIIIFAYFTLILGFGSYFARYNKTTNDFFFSGRRFSWWLIAMSIVATGVGSHSFLKYSAKAYEHGFSSTMTYMNDWFFIPFFLFGWLPIVYYTKVKSIPDYFEKRFGSGVRKLATFAILGYMIGYIAIGFLTMGKTLQPILGWNIYTIVAVVAVIAGIYITFGGQTAVIFTDLAQGFILIFAGILIFVLGINYVGGFSIFWNSLSPEFKLPLAHFNEPSNFNFSGIFWQDGVAGSVGFLFMNQGLIMRFMATKSVNEGRKAAAFNILFLLPISTIVVSNAGWVGKSISILTPEKWDATVKLDHVFTQVAGLITTSEVVFAFIIAAVAAALMSTVDTLINAVAAVVVNDVYKPIVKDRDDKHYLKVAMIVSAGATALGAISVVFFNNFPTLYEAHGFFHSTMTPPLVVAIFLGIFWKRYTTEAAVATFIGGAFLMWLGNKYPGILIAPFDHGIEMDPEHPYSYIRALYNTLVCLSVGVVVSLFTTPKTEEEMDGITVWSLDRAREKFKGSKPNDREGKKPITTWKIVEGQDELVRFSQKEMDFMAAEVGDLVYISDSRGWLGGLKSCHSVYGKVHDEEGMVYISAEIADSAMFVEGKTVKSEKEM